MNGMQQQELAEKVGISKSFLSHVERGRKGMSPANANKTAAALGVPLNSLFLLYEHDESKDDSGTERKAS